MTFKKWQYFFFGWKKKTKEKIFFDCKENLVFKLLVILFLLSVHLNNWSDLLFYCNFSSLNLLFYWFLCLKLNSNECLKMNFENSSNNVLKRCASLNNLMIQNLTTGAVNAQTSSPTVNSREPTNFSNVFTHRTRRFSASCSNNAGLLSPSPGSPCLAPRVSQLRQEECAEVSNQRELNHEREIHSALQISQSCDDLTLITENWSVKNNDDLTNPLHVALPSTTSCSSPSPTR
jgi:hypothetical protein